MVYSNQQHCIYRTSFLSKSISYGCSL